MVAVNTSAQWWVKQCCARVDLAMNVSLAPEPVKT